VQRNERGEWIKKVRGQSVSQGPGGGESGNGFTGLINGARRKRDGRKALHNVGKLLEKTKMFPGKCRNSKVVKEKRGANYVREPAKN